MGTRGILALAAIACAVAASGCGGKSAVKGCMDPTAVNYDPQATESDGSCLAFQGPRDPDFEVGGSWVMDTNGYAGNGSLDIATGTAFMPTHGLKYLRYFSGTSNNFWSGSRTIYQDGVSFQRSTTLTFDYAASGYATASGTSLRVEILFTSTGTVTLWSKDFTGSFAPQVLNETVTLPALPDTGRLTIQFSATGGQNTSGGVQIDNFRVN